MVLRKPSFEELRLDRSFVANCETDKVNAPLCKSVIDLAPPSAATWSRFGLEKAADALALVSKGCDYGQAFVSVCRGQKSDLYRCSASARYPRPQPRWR